uniref:PD-(D/E)XK endonuclease-like domain-containing protein n=1 Tax=Thermosporothrix sp. COM3 TaxID=2490863 RepID=A0A455SYF2_9CHLR|nr:hypothetical protein KTC_48700 [Thermosporothrix sp. COM3]BBH90184.1 hypothetical protein KTC_49350 [Thermosporothrix sp. COM3]BBH90249.1 hypothetical protein KTC_50000 [Thermosporothrix sp. COM3]
MTFQNSNKPNLKALAALLRLELDDMFNSWEASKPLRTGAPHASAILVPESEWCPRRHVLLALHPEQARRPEAKPWDALQNAVFLHGWHLHEKYQKLFSDFARVIEVEKSHFDETRFLHFTPDAIIQFGSYKLIVEIKGYKQETWQALDERGNPPEAAWHQCNLYCHLLNIPYGLVLVENKNTQKVKMWAIEHDKELAQPYTRRMYEVVGGVIKAQKSGRLPARKCTAPDEPRAQKCPVRELCFSLKNGAEI